MLGKQVFEKNCMVCHTLEGTGGKVGPELTGVGARPKADILMQVLDPNRSVEGTFREWTAKTNDGEFVSGRLMDRDGDHRRHPGRHRQDPHASAEGPQEPYRLGARDHARGVRGAEARGAVIGRGVFGDEQGQTLIRMEMTNVLMTEVMRYLISIFVMPALCVVASASDPKVNLVVASDGTGDYKTVQEAVDAAPAGGKSRFVIRIKPGTYKARLTIPENKPKLTFIGDDAEKTILTESATARDLGPDGKEIGTFATPSTSVKADDFVAENITFENAAGNRGQALAITVTGDRAIFRNCRFLGWQDTILVNAGRQYFADCYIAGHVDFIFGAATCYFERCHIHCLSAGYVTAASTPEDHPFGYVFSHCKITAEPGVKKVYLGRPWRPFASVTFLNTEMSDAILPAGWDNWRDPAAREDGTIRRVQEQRSRGKTETPGGVGEAARRCASRGDYDRQRSGRTGSLETKPVGSASWHRPSALFSRHKHKPGTLVLRTFRWSFFQNKH